MAPDPRSPAIVLRGLLKRYDDFCAVDELSLEIPRGEIFGFLGPNGAGKTTTIRLLMGVLIPTAGAASIEGFDSHRERLEVVRRVGYLPDNPVFYDYLRGREVLEFVAEMHGYDRAEARRRTRQLLYELALVEAGEDFAVNYSTGMKKKLGLACALIHEPSVLILDEPTNGLDPRAAREVQERVTAFAASGNTVFLSTHLLDMAERLCTRIGIIHKGRLAALGSLNELCSRTPENPSLEEFFLSITEKGGTSVAAS